MKFARIPIKLNMAGVRESAGLTDTEMERKVPEALAAAGGAWIEAPRDGCPAMTKTDGVFQPVSKSIVPTSGTKKEREAGAGLSCFPSTPIFVF